MSRIFLISDTHFGQDSICNFLDDNGNKLRPWANSQEMDEALVHNWNSVVREGDKVYHLGDVAYNKKSLDILSRLNGKKVLIKGNHDTLDAKEYLKYFKDIRSYHIIDGMLMSHIPIHDGSFERFSVNVHGHLHSKFVLKESLSDNRYFSVCVEKINFTPINLDEVISLIIKNGGSATLKPRLQNACPT